MDYINILNLFDGDMDAIYFEIEEKMKSEYPDYDDSKKNFYREITALGNGKCDLIESNVNNMESIAKRVSFSEGFRHGIKFIIEQLSGHRIDVDSLIKLLDSKPVHESQVNKSFDDFICNRIDEVLTNSPEVEAIQEKVLAKEFELCSNLDEKTHKIFNEYDSLTGEKEGIYLDLIYKAAFKDGRNMPFSR